MEKCDHLSVGVIVQSGDNVLLLERARFPYGLAAPAGHVDQHGSLEQTAIEEVQEEVGLVIATESLIKVIDGQRFNNSCRRPGGDYHDWTVFTTQRFEGRLKPSADEAKSANWYSPSELQIVADNTMTSKKKDIFEFIWLNFFVELGFVS